MLDEDVIKKNTQTISERILIANILLIVLLPALLLGGNSYIGSGLLVALGMVAPINIVIFGKVWQDAPRFVFLKYLFALSPFLAALAISLIGSANPCIVEFSQGGNSFLELAKNISAPICSAAANTEDALFPPLENLAVVASALSIYFICDSRYILRRILSYCVIGVTVLAIIGLLLHMSIFIENFGNMLAARNDIFATFSKSSEWCVFAMIWMSAAFACALYSSTHKTLGSFIFSFRFLMLFCASVLFSSTIITGSPLERIFSASVFGLGMLLFAISAFPEISELLHKIKGGKIASVLSKLLSPATYILLSLFACAIIFGIFKSSFSNQNEKLLVSESSPITLQQKALLFEDSVKLINDRPVFGWGSGSFPTIFGFAQGSDLSDSSWSSPTSDLIKKLVETGFVGVALCFVMPLVIFLRQLPRFDFGLTSVIMLGTITCVLLISIVASPFESGSVYASFWILLSGFLTWNKKDID